MKAYKDFIISPIGDRYNNSKKIGDKELILNTEIFNHQYVNRLARVIATPLLFQSPINGCSLSTSNLFVDFIG